MQLKVGDIVEGKITKVKEYGVFADIGDGKFGMVHISEVAHTYVSDIRDFVKENDVVKMKVLNISEDGKISLSIKKALPQEEGEGSGNSEANRERRQRKAPAKPDGSYIWTPKKTEPSSFEEMMSQFKASSDEKISDLKRKNPEARRSKRGANTR